MSTRETTRPRKHGTANPYPQSTVFVVTPTFVALLVSCQGIALRAAEPEASLAKASQAASAGDSAVAVRWATEAIKVAPAEPDAYYLRGREHFRLSKLAESIRDFDRYVQLRPEHKSRQWERGIALYYAGRYEEGAAQFELYQTFSNTDVENSVWRFLCMVPTDGLERAREVMLSIRNDPRVPMMQIFDLYRGRLKPEGLLAAVEEGDPPPRELAKRRFYAFLYLGLYFEVAGDAESAAKYVNLAADKRYRSAPGINRYMWDVARIHSERLPQRFKSQKQL
jgi:lipoprotein NlpI